MGLIDRYITRAVATPLVLSLCIAGMLLLLEQMLRLFDFVLAEQGPVDVVWRMLANLLPHYLSLALPLGAFLGVQLAFRNLSLSSELDALNSGGASAARLLRPVYMLFGVLLLADFVLVSYVAPYANYRYEQIRFDVTSGAFGIKIPQGEFVEITDNVTIRLGKINTETRDAEDIFLEQRDSRGGKTTITARYGAISTTPDFTRLLLKMRDGRQVFIDPSGERANALSFETFDVEVDLPAIAAFRARGGKETEATVTELWHLLRTQTPQSDPLWNEYRAGFHFRIIHALSFLLLPILAVATGVTGRRRTSTLRPIIGIALVIVYHELLEEWGQVVVSEGKLSPYLSMWGIFFVFAFVSISLYRGSIDKARTARVMGRREEPTVRVLSTGEVDEGDSDFAPPAQRINP
ncbi:MAG TPA: LptF/LptG family permease [Parvularculaceae bacterium]|nr:LptF/LptG family permease [Parvularculaceae bacterium]